MNNQQQATEAVAPIQAAFSYYDENDRPSVVISQSVTVDQLYQAHLQWRRMLNDDVPLEWTISTEIIDGVKTDVLDVADWDVTVDEYGDIVGNHQLLGFEKFRSQAFIVQNGGILAIHCPCDPKRLFYSLRRQGVDCSFDDEEFLLHLPGWSVFISANLSYPFIPRGGVASYNSLTMHQPEQLEKMMSDIMSDLTQSQAAQAEADLPETNEVTEDTTSADLTTSTEPTSSASQEAADEPAQGALAQALLRANELAQALKAQPITAEVTSLTEVLPDPQPVVEMVIESAPANPEVIPEVAVAEEAPIGNGLLITSDNPAEEDGTLLRTERTGLGNKGGKKPNRRREEDNEFRGNTASRAFDRQGDGRAERKPFPKKERFDAERNQFPHHSPAKAREEQKPVDYSRIGRVSMNNDVLSKLAERMRQNMPKDGIDSINIGAAAETEMGKKLMAQSRTPFDHPDLGRFDTLLGFQYYILSEPMEARLRTLSGTALRNWKRRSTLKYFEGWMKVVAEAFWFKVHTVPGLVEQLLGNDLPFRSYYLEEQGGQTVVCPTVDEVWMTAILNEITRVLKARARIEDEDARLKIVPNFNFLAAMEARKVGNFGRHRD